METPEEAQSVHGRQLIEIDGVTMIAPHPEKLTIGVTVEGKIEEVDPQVEGVLGAVPFDIEYLVTGPFRDAIRTAKVRPVKGGSNIAPSGMQGYGTSGFLMTDGSDYFVVSNNHVFAQNDQLSMGHSIVQPGEPYHGGKSPPFKVGELAGKVRMRDGVKGDVAWAELSTDATSQMIGIGRHEGPAIGLKPGDSIKKSGATTGVTSGRVETTNATIRVGHHDGGSTVVGGTVLTSDSMSEGGDSGSPVVKKDSQGRNRPAGIIFGGSDALSAITPATTIASMSGLEFANASEPTLPDKASMCLPDGAGSMHYTLEVSGEIRGRDGELEPGDDISGSVVSGRLTGGFCDKFQFEGPIKRLSWDGPTPNIWVNRNRIDLNTVSWADPPAKDEPPDDPPDDPDTDPKPPRSGDDSGKGGILVLGLAALALADREG